MLNSPSVHCTDPACHASSIRLVHQSRQWFAVTGADGRQGQAHLLVYRCSACGHMWATHASNVECLLDLSPRPNQALRASA